MKEKYPLKLKPVFKEIIWGGDLLRRRYHKKCDMEKLAESWELTVHPAGMSVIENGPCAGMSLSDYLECGYDFPLLVKFIDANDRLSVQVHPNKTEMWYIVEAKEGAELIYGLESEFDEASFRQALTDHTLDHLLHHVKVHAGEFYLLPSGLIHAIGSGILIAEFQQNSNVTYRVYDYDRGREIHTEQAIDTIKKLGISTYTPGATECDFFAVHKYELQSGNTLTLDATDRFLHLLCIDGTGTVGGGALHDAPVIRGDSYYLPQGLRYDLQATETLTVIVTKCK